MRRPTPETDQPVNLANAFTPALILDRTRLRHNCARMLARARALGVRLRPHMKTLKSADAARLAVDPGHGGIAVSTFSEAEYFTAKGFGDIQYAVCLAPAKLERAAALAQSVPRFSFFLDSLETAKAVADFANANALPLRAWIEIDSGEHRTGLDPADERLVEIARTLAASPVLLEGVATHGGHSYGGRDRETIAAIAEQERAAVVAAAERLRGAGVDVAGVSAGSTPTASHARSAEDLSEWRPGVYMAGDLFQAAIGSLEETNIAVSVLASVISQQPEQNRIVIDAGGLALSKDRSTAALDGGDAGYGLVCDLDGRTSFGRLIVGSVHQEHGEIDGSENAPLPFDRLPIGARVRILPNHVCMTAGAYDRLLVVDAGRDIADEWDKATGW
ncbi:MAG: alanine racemase [Sphingosinicella sp.]